MGVGNGSGWQGVHIGFVVVACGSLAYHPHPMGDSMWMRWRSWIWQHKWVLLILLTAVSLRLFQITQTPPGLTHDEADHGITAWDIVQGEHSLYFSVGYGREPLYDYAMAVAMTLLGPSYLAGRLTAVFFSLIAIVGLYAWARRAFDQPTALMAAAGLAVGFWGVMAARQSLRSITLPALFVGAICFYWKGINNQQSTVNKKKLTIDNYQLSIVNFLSAGVLLGLSFYTYIPARGMWVLFLAVA
ncbi:MAG: hypothetical protein GY943_34350, partial [Chloroflexi bacterium]|nr:hypothetical protein [Chloroflexota bacterium]